MSSSCDGKNDLKDLKSFLESKCNISNYIICDYGGDCNFIEFSTGASLK